VQQCRWPVAELITHSGDKILLGRVIEYDQEQLVAEAEVQADSVYLRGDAEPSWLGLEYMAQGVAAFAGVRRREAGGTPKVGMLIGTRKYRCQLQSLPVGLKMRIEVKALFEDEQGLSVFGCRIMADELIAEANLNVFQPPNIDSFLRTKKL